MSKYIPESEIGKYRKKREKKSFQKSDHKHVYNKECLLRIPNSYCKSRRHIVHCTYCNICGHIGTIKYFEFDENHRLLTSEQILEKYSNLEIIDYEGNSDNINKG